MPTRAYAALTVRKGLVHLDSLHRMLAWHRSGLLAPGLCRWRSRCVGLAASDQGHGAGHEEDGLHVDPGR
ncbi:DUF6309 family protein [Streptomyces sp. NPDC088180]|uniref:DUF6309 family protein n=1 Tax=Streptomyces sp. NPDC088180 TaxID=3365837 RepID=UPI003811A52B